MSAPSYLVVPVDLTALCVGTPDVLGQGVFDPAAHVPPLADFSVLPWAGNGGVHNPGPYLSTSALADSQPLADQSPFQAGVYLHWALPKGLTAGVSGQQGLSFPTVPNRWLLTRLVARTGPKAKTPIRITSWVVESDLMSSTSTAKPGQPQATAPLTWDAAPNFGYLGAAFPLDKWEERLGVERLSPLTALGYGDPAFASFAPNCYNVFAYIDDFSDFPDYDPHTDHVSYQLSGWYDDGAVDPLNQPGVKPADFHWYSSNGATPPTRIVCAGVIDAVPWNTGTQYLTDRPAPLSVAVGPSTPEAFSALLAHALDAAAPHAFPDAEAMLNALQFGALSADMRAGSLAALEKDVHDAGFDTLYSGPLWTVTDRSANGDEGGEITLPDGLADQLNALNVTQLQRTDKAFTVQGLQTQLFADWSKYLLIDHAPDEVPPPLQRAATAAQQYLSGQTTAIGDLLADIAALDDQIGAAATALRASLEAGWDLDPTTSAPRFYLPSNPALILCGKDVTPSPRYGASSVEDFTICRLDSEIVTGVTLPAGLVTGSKAISLGQAGLPTLAYLPKSAPSALLQGLMQEALLMCSGLQAAVTADLAKLGGPGNPAVINRAATEKALTAAARAFTAGQPLADIDYIGAAPSDPYLTTWNGTPWLPVMVQYGVDVSPVQRLVPGEAGSTYAPDFIADNFVFDPDTVDLAYTGAAPAQPQSYNGTLMLTPSGTALVRNEISRFETNTGVSDPELNDILELLDKLPLMNQTLSGLTSAMGMRHATLQMPVRDPLAPLDLQRRVVDPVAAAIGRGNIEAPMPTVSFNPIRAGTMSVRQLRLIDTFGRTKLYKSPATVVASGLRPTGTPAGQAFLPPRLTQPARLMFRWHAADNDMVETNSDPATTPVFGWVVPNGLDRSILLHDAEGSALGELSLSGDGKRALWTAAPGGDFPFGASIDTVMAGRNTHLVDFALGVFNGGDATFLAPFLATVQHAVTFMLPARYREDAALSALVSQPLALARAALKLDVAGGTRRDQSWDTFADVLNGGEGSDGGLSGVAFPVKLGALTQLDDTLVGYWVQGDDGATDFRRFFSEASTVPAGGPPQPVQKPSQDTLTLTPGATADAGAVVTVLMDPRGCVNATTGILPAKQIDIPREQYGPLLERFAVTFQISPVLSGSSAPPAELGQGRPMVLVQPKVADGDWKWVTAEADRWSSVDLPKAAPIDATLDYTPQALAEGWLQLTPTRPSPIKASPTPSLPTQPSSPETGQRESPCADL